MNKFVRLPRLPLGVMVDKHSQLARRWCIWFSLTILIGFPVNAFCVGFELEEEHHGRVSLQSIKFPASCVGTVEVVRRKKNTSGAILNLGHPLISRQAVGSVNLKVPAEDIILLALNVRALSTPQLLKSIPANSIKALLINFYSMDKKEDNLCNRAMKYVCGWKQLEYLILDDSDVSDEGLQQIDALQKLKGLSLISTRSNGGCFKKLGQLPNLEHLVVERCVLEEGNIAYLSASSNLRMLSLRWTNVSTVGLKFLKKCQNLEVLDVSKGKFVNDDAVLQIASLKGLRMLDLNETPVTDKGLESLINLAKLENLVLDNTRISDKSVAILQKLKNIKVLNLSNTQITEAGIMRLSGMGLKELALPRKTYSVAFINKFHKASPKTVFLPFSNSRSVYNDQDFLLISQPKAGN